MKTLKVLKHFHKDYSVGKNYEVDDETAKAWIDSGLAAATNLEDLVEDMQDKLASVEAEANDTTEAVVRAVEQAIATKTNKVELAPSIKIKEEGKSFGDYLKYAGLSASRDQNQARKAYEVLQNKYATKSGTVITEGTSTLAGNLIPYEFIPQLLYAEGYDPIWRKCNIRNTVRDQVKIPVLDQTSVPANNFSSAFAGGVSIGFVSEATQPTNTTFATKQITLNILKTLGVAQVSNEALSDSPISLQQTITDQFAKAYNALTDGNVLNGNGSSQFTGIIGHAATLSVARQTASQFSLVDAANMSAQMLPSSRNRACWVLSPGAWGQLLTFKDAAGRIVFWTGLDVTGAPAATLFGLPVYVNEHSPSLGTAGDVLLVDLSGYIIAQRMDISLMASTEFAFGQDLVTYRMVARYNGIPTYTAPFTLSNGTDTVSYAVQLGNASS